MLDPLRPLRRACHAALEMLLPPSCPVCMAATDSAHGLCADCFGRTGFVTEPCCAVCGIPFVSAEQGGAARICHPCTLSRPQFGQARAALRYDAQARRLILPFKHADRTDLARTLAPMMARAGAALLRRADVLVPVPLHRARLRRRRYNQAALLARAVGGLAEKPVLVDALVRTRHTEALGRLGAAAREAEVAGAVEVRPGREAWIAGKRILLVDDVMTSGATASVCAEALLDAEAASVDVLAAARVPDPRLT